MASPPQGLRAQKRGPRSDPPFVEHIERAHELRAPHVIGVRPEAGVPDPLVGGRRPQAAPATPQILEPAVLDPALAKRGSKGLQGEPGMTPRSRETSNVGDLRDAMALEEREKLRHLMGRVAHRPNTFALTRIPGLRTLSPHSVTSFRSAGSRLTPRVVAMTWLVGSLAACEGDDTATDSGPARRSSVEQRVAEPARPESGSSGSLILEAVEVPAAFPPEFPIADESTVVQVSAREGTTGTWSTITIVARGDPADVFEWYRSALETAGWTVQPGASDAPARVLHASRVDSYLDLATEPHPLDPASGWVRTHAEIWMTHP